MCITENVMRLSRLITCWWMEKMLARRVVNARFQASSNKHLFTVGVAKMVSTDMSGYLLSARVSISVNDSWQRLDVGRCHVYPRLQRDGTLFLLGTHSDNA